MKGEGKEGGGKRMREGEEAGRGRGKVEVERPMALMSNLLQTIVQ